MRLCIAKGEEMRNFIYRSIKKMPSGKIKVKFTTSPIIAEKYGGVTCRSTSNVHPIPILLKNWSALEIQKPSSFSPH